jgi:hypothetical protein
VESMPGVRRRPSALGAGVRRARTPRRVQDAGHHRGDKGPTPDTAPRA